MGEGFSVFGGEPLVDAPKFPAERVDFGAVIPWKLGVLDRSFDRFEHLASPELRAEFDRFRDEQSAWLADFSLFMALKEAFGGGSWVNWPAVLRARQPQALDEARQRYAHDIKRQEYRQFVFFRQWQALRERAAARGIRIIGDIPFFVTHDSAEVWATAAVLPGFAGKSDRRSGGATGLFHAHRAAVGESPKSPGSDDVAFPDAGLERKALSEPLVLAVLREFEAATLHKVQPSPPAGPGVAVVRAGCAAADAGEESEESQDVEAPPEEE